MCLIETARFVCLSFVSLMEHKADAISGIATTPTEVYLSQSQTADGAVKNTRLGGLYD